MGCGPSKEDRELAARNEEIEAQLKKDRIAARNEIKMLLLGAGESGKSTILKQLKLINHGAYSVEERLSYKEIIYSNTLQSMRVVLDAMENLDIPLADGNNAPRAEIILGLPSQVETDRLPREVADAIYGLWMDRGVQACVERSREYQLNDSARYYFDSIERMAAPDYVPNDQDVLRSRVKTTGITETHFQIGDLNYKVFDVGGQRSERKKWIHCFENVTAIIFLVAISEYDQLLYEDQNVNRMQEALTLFDSICNSRWFVRTSIILFLNKIDLFRSKLLTSPLSDYFSDFQLPPSAHNNPDEVYNAASEYIVQRFVSLNQAPTKTIYTHFTCATDTQQIKFVLSAVNDIIITLNLRSCGLL
ncbi:putative guanine nucleotide-binding protein alpha-1 subunit [Jaminaea rosea]|uniref:Putative guanine nucleotide-binding protein alpha-1 subunit n=1 Tax=Jaminaea rosea TaxID=1569628 RepID=A0A316UJG5_9BASI|nr:putative guanine nucleotide-binding protein alpha-1 subunit [Jaminaea rosea]PWN25359.1 putative guanine nucleotide-binding protein alpha-1 subunit [Jaminaea rosea]